MEDNDLYYDLAKFEVEMIASRGNFLLVFQSMLFGAVASLADKDTFIPVWLLIALGLATSVTWLYMNWLTSVVGDEALVKLKDVDPRLHELFEQKKGESVVYRVGSISWIMTWVFPLLTGIVWATLLVANLNSEQTPKSTQTERAVGYITDGPASTCDSFILHEAEQD